MHRIGTLPFDIKDDAVALLFVTSQTRGRWILPKGLAKTGETHVQTCEREGFEEAGVKGLVLKDFPVTVSINKQTDDGKQAVPVTYYPLLVNEQFDEWPEMDVRERHWALIGEASKVAFREDYLGLIRQFEALMPWIKEAAKTSRS
jgi:8-oxo-dGTP pyrophosphatase MutT (NUDIX family)